MRERVYHNQGASWGQRIGCDRPEGQVAELETENAATPQRVEAARRLFPEASIDDFEHPSSRCSRST